MTVTEVLSLFATCTGAGVIFGAIVFTVLHLIQWALFMLRNG